MVKERKIVSAHSSIMTSISN